MLHDEISKASDKIAEALTSKLSKFNMPNASFITEKHLFQRHGYVKILLDCNKTDIINQAEFFKAEYIKKQIEIKDTQLKSYNLNIFIEEELQSIKKKSLGYNIINEISQSLHQALINASGKQILTEGLSVYILLKDITEPKVIQDSFSINIEIPITKLVNLGQQYNDDLKTILKYNKDVTVKSNSELLVKGERFRSEITGHYIDQVEKLLKQNNVLYKIKKNSSGAEFFFYLD